MNKSNIKLKHAIKIKMWLCRINADKFQSPEIQRATAVLSRASDFIRKMNEEKEVYSEIDNDENTEEDGCRNNDHDFNAQETSCLSAIAALHWWVQIDPVAAANIEAVFTRFSFQSLIETIEIRPQFTNDAIFVMNVSKAIQNVMKRVRSEAKDSQMPLLFGKTGPRSVYLSKLLSPGQLVKDVKVALTDALVLEGQDHAALEASLDHFSASVDLSVSTKDKTRLLEGSVETFTRQQDSSMGDARDMKPPPEISVLNDSTTNRAHHGVAYNDSESGSDSGSESGSDDVDFTGTGGVAVPPQTMTAVDRPHRRLSCQVKPPSLAKGVVVDPGRVSRWQEDEEKHQRGKEHHRRMTANNLMKEVERLSRFTPKRQTRSKSVSPDRQADNIPILRPSSPSGQKASNLSNRPRSTATAIVPQPRGLPPPELDAELSIVSVKSFIENVLGDSMDTLSQEKSSPLKGVKTFSKSACSNTVSILECYSVGSNHPKQPSTEIKEDSFPVQSQEKKTTVKMATSDIHAPEAWNNVAEGFRPDDEMSDSTPRTGSAMSQSVGNRSRPPSTQRKHSTPGRSRRLRDRSMDDKSEGLCKPQSFALQMINELTELKGRADDMTEEEKARLQYINNAINSIIKQETSMVNDISDRLEVIRIESEEESRAEEEDRFKIKVPAKNTRDPLTPFYYNVKRPQNTDESRDTDVPLLSDLISYKKFASLHREKNASVLTELASLDLNN